MSLSDSVENLTGVGKETAVRLNRLGIKTIEDLVYYFPRRYNDYSLVTNIAELQPGLVTIRVRIDSVSQRHSRRGLHITEAVVSDDTSSLNVVWFNQPYRASSLKPKAEYFMSGEFAFKNRRYSLLNPAVELSSRFTKNTARIVPVYPETKGLKSHTLRKLIYNLLPAINELPESLPSQVIRSQKLMAHNSAVKQMHFPDSAQKLKAAQHRLGFEEVFSLILASLLSKREIEAQKGQAIKFEETLARAFVGRLDYKLTDAQRLVAWQILQDMMMTRPMNRLLEGDVGSGKTVVAVLAALMALNQGFQVAYLAPTEILARQQHKTVAKLLSPFGYKPQLLIGSLSAAKKRQLHDLLKTGKSQIVVGTHALIQNQVKFSNLGLIIVDEQHRYGVQQRRELLKKSKLMPHVLTMSATPIPRSLALVLYGELDISIIDQLPPGRKLVKTEIHSPNSRQQLYDKIDAQIKSGRQVFVICPLISDSDLLGVKSVEAEHKRLSAGAFKHRKIALLHGRLKSSEKDKIMRDFKAGKYDILVSTTVVEVGVDIPNASVMLIEGAERFGLAQLHQLRGRVGRAEHQAYCYLVPTESSVPQRLRALMSTNDGFKLAEIDLELRGPGEIYGGRQHGALDLRIAKLSDHKLISAARQAAAEYATSAQDLLQYPRLAKRINQLRAITNLN